MFSRAGGTLALYRWIPWVSRAVPFDRPNQGDPFVLPTSPKVEVELLTDLPMTLAAPAADITEVTAGTGDYWSFSMDNVRDVSLVLAPDFQVFTGKVERHPGPRVHALRRGRRAAAALAGHPGRDPTRRTGSASPTRGRRWRSSRRSAAPGSSRRGSSGSRAA